VIRVMSAALALCLVPIAASAQTDAVRDLMRADQPGQGPMVVEQIHNGFLAAPEFKITELNHRWAGLAGGYGGVVFDEHFLVGGGAYGLVANRHGRDLVYGGLVLQWLSGRSDDTFSFGAKTLLGGGHAEVPADVHVQPLIFPPPRDEFFRIGQNFFVAEPEFDARVRLGPHLRLTVGAGYRFTGTAHGRNYFFDGSGHTGLNGAVGSIGVQIGGGS